MAEAEKKERKLPPKKPTAQKRDIQNVKKNLRNRAFKSRVRTATRAFEGAIQLDKEKAKAALNALYSLMDKGVKRGIFKLGNANRQKSRMTAKLNKL